MSEEESIRYSFEKIPTSEGGNFNRFAKITHRLLEESPMILSKLPFSTSAGASGGVLELPKHLTEKETLKLKSIELPDKTILIKNYYINGLLSKTEYVNGEVVCYEYTKEGQIERVSLGDTYPIFYQYDKSGNIIKSIYGKTPNVEFLYEWREPSSEIIFHQGQGNEKKSKFQLKLNKTLQSLESADGKISYHKKNAEEIPSLHITAGIVNLSCNNLCGSAEVIRTAGPEGSITMVSPFGIHIINKFGYLRSWMGRNLDYIRLFYDTNDQISRVWSLRGQAFMNYEKYNKGILSIIRADGKKYLWYGSRNKGTVFLAGPDEAFLLHYDQLGRLEEILDSWGGFLSYKYGEEGNFPRTISTSLGYKTEITYDKNKYLSSVNSEKQGAVSLEYNSNHELKKVSWKGNNPEGLMKILHFTGWLWSMMLAGEKVYAGVFEWLNLVD